MGRCVRFSSNGLVETDVEALSSLARSLDSNENVLVFWQDRFDPVFDFVHILHCSID